MTINRNKNSNKFCGPNALAALTGLHVDETAYALRVASGKRAIKGIQSRHMVAALELLGYRATTVPLAQKKVTLTYPRCRPRGITFPTLTQVLKALKGRDSKARYLVIVTGHYVTFQGRMLFDNKHPQGVRLAECPYRRKRVRGLWLVEKEGAATLPAPTRGMTLAQFSYAVAKLGLEINGDFVDAPHGWHYQDGLHSLAHCGYDYREMLDSLEFSLLPLVKCDDDCDCQE